MVAGASFVAAIVSILLAVALAVKDRRSLANRCFIAGIALLALVEVFRGLSVQAQLPSELLFWQKVRIAFSALLPGTWLMFSLTFARAEYRSSLSRWRWVLTGAFVLPILTLILFAGAFFLEPAIMDPNGTYLLPLGPAGKGFQVLLLLSAVAILANLETTLRAATGRIRWQIKFIMLGLGGICALWIYSASQALLYSALNTSYGVLHPVALLAANILFGWGLIRSRFLNVDVYLSRTTLQHSLTVLLAGIYLLAVGLLVQVVKYISPDRPLPFDALIVLMALAGLAVLMMSDRLQEKLKRVITRNFKRPRYDYRKAWMDLTQRTTSLADVHETCTEVSKIVSQTLGFLSVNIWLRDGEESRLRLMGSTVFTRPQAQELMREGEAVAEVLGEVAGKVTPLDLLHQSYEWSNQIMQAKPEYFADFKMRYILPIQTGGQLVGLLTLNDDRVGRASLTIEDHDLLHAYTSQLAANVLQMRLSEHLRQTRELEAFQNVSAFFVHDLKNLASRLSLTMQNLPLHFDNPEFRTDALRSIGQSVSQMNEMCGRLSLLRQKIELKMVEVDINELVTAALKGIELGTNEICEKLFKPLPRVFVDPEQMQKVICNLVLNAHEAIGAGGRVRIETGRSGEHITISVLDTGSGMSQEFIERSLFHPFKSTKKRGMGIGLYHSKMIVEAHHGRIEVESQPQKGSVFRVVLPLHQPLALTVNH